MHIDWYLMKMRDWCMAVDKKKTITKMSAISKTENRTYERRN